MFNFFSVYDRMTVLYDKRSISIRVQDFLLSITVSVYQIPRLFGESIRLILLFSVIDVEDTRIETVVTTTKKLERTQTF
jgi:hypothetical protein